MSEFQIDELIKVIERIEALSMDVDLQAEQYSKALLFDIVISIAREALEKV